MKIKKIISQLVVLALALAQLSIAQAQTENTYYVPDAAGSPIAATDQAGNVKWRKHYRPFGEEIEQGESSKDNRIGYTGHVHDRDTGLTYMGARYYDPVLGRFMGRDPVGFVDSNPLSMNRFAYGNNSPYKFVDPDGRNPKNFTIGGALILGAKIISSKLKPAKPLKENQKSSKEFDKTDADATKSGSDGASGSVTTPEGNTFSGNSTGSTATGGSPRDPMHPQVQEALDKVKKPSRSHGACCEIDAFNKALNSGDSLKGAKMGPVTLNKSGKVLGACSTCREVKRSLGVE